MVTRWRIRYFAPSAFILTRLMQSIQSCSKSFAISLDPVHSSPALQRSHPGARGSQQACAMVPDGAYNIGLPDVECFERPADCNLPSLCQAVDFCPFRRGEARTLPTRHSQAHFQPRVSHLESQKAVP